MFAVSYFIHYINILSENKMQEQQREKGPEPNNQNNKDQGEVIEQGEKGRETVRSRQKEAGKFQGGSEEGMKDTFIIDLTD